MAPEDPPQPPADPTRRRFIGTAAAVAGGLLVGCVDDGASVADPDAGLRATDRGRPDAAIEPDATPEADAAPDPEPDAAPDPEPDAAPDPEPDSAPDPEPDAAPDPEPDAAPEPEPDAAPEPEPDAAPDPEPDAAPEPDAGPPPFDPAVELPEVDHFPLGIAAGDALPDGAVLQTRHTGNAPLAVWLWPAPPPGEAPTVEQITEHPAIRAEGGFVHVDAPGLSPATRHHFAFVELDDAGRAVARSPIGRFRTALSPDSLDTVVFGACSCTSNGNAFDTLSDAADRDDLDLFVLLGDTTYADGAVDRASYRGKWAENLETEAYRRLRASTGLLATWDDHEVGNNWDPERIEPAQVAAARAAFFEHLPLRRDPMAPDRIWKSIRWGRTVEFFVLDSRSERLPSGRLGADAEYLSAAQFDWLLAGLRASEAVFKVVCSSVPAGDFPYPLDDDRWSGYPAQRDALMQAIELDRIEGVVFIAGDFHHASAGRLTAAGPGSQIPEFLCGPGGQFPNPGYLLLPGLPQFDWGTGINNYTVFTLDPRGRQLHVAWISALGRLLHEAVVEV